MVRVAGHFGEWVQGRVGPGGPLALVTVSCPALAVTARVEKDGSAGIDQRPVVLSPEAIARLVAALGLSPGRVVMRAEMPPGGGAGASTAALVALARTCGSAAGPAEIAAACLAAEGATDPLMMPAPDALLWAPRAARPLRAVPPPPRAEIVGGFFGPPIATDPADLDFPDVQDLIESWGAARSLSRIAWIASTSARRTTRARGPKDDPTAEIARELGALGWVRAHTGSARGLIFAPGTVPPTAEPALAAAGLTGIMRFATGGRA
ncbi:hypothetical protein ROJ8625_02787 [Roseivivax jejudonensis]|uniref:L-threonine kinase n=1 Tax=Roseivivax jejudonensis TaxID=1529041 RepID=A0A1X6ZLZ8_9RHOB|nr:hypothetical protein [Roseivivax jejudonensis]SLN55604.1 hypothetical protein ROJ8625_02787 [Roseivivax jejudonensis]